MVSSELFRKSCRGATCGESFRSGSEDVISSANVVVVDVAVVVDVKLEDASSWFSVLLRFRSLFSRRFRFRSSSKALRCAMTACIWICNTAI